MAVDKRAATPPTLEQLLHDSRTHPFMLEFLQKRQAEVLLMLWADCEQFKQLMGKPNEISSQAKKIIDIHFRHGARTREIIGPEESAHVLEQFEKGHPTLDMFAGAQRECVRQLKSDHFPVFLESKSYKEMLQSNVDIKQWTLMDVFRDPKRIRALNLLLLAEKPDYVETLRFALDLRNRYTPLQAKSLLPVHDNPSSQASKGIPQQKSSNKQKAVNELIELGKFLEKKYLTVDSKQFARGVSIATATRVRTALDECSQRLDAASYIANHQHIGGTTINQASAATRWVRGGALGTVSGAHTSGQSTSQVGPNVAALDEIIKILSDAFKQAEEEAISWLERYALIDARKTDYFLTPILEPPSPNKSIYLEDAPSQDVISVVRLNEQDMLWRSLGPHKLKNRDMLVLSDLKKQPLSHLVILKTTHVASKEVSAAMAADSTGATVSGSSRGLKFRTKVLKRYNFNAKMLQRQNSARLVEEEVIQQAARVTSLAGVSQQESVAENAARARMFTSFDSSTLTSSELHSHCFPMQLGIEVDPVTFANEPETQVVYHSFCIPCRTSRHSFDSGCSCVFGMCLTRVSKKVVLIPTGARRDMNTTETSVLSTETSGSFTTSKTRGKSPRSQNYTETVVELNKVPNFGLGLNLALNKDGSVEVTRFVSDVQTPSPAAASGKICVEDELMFVNRVSVHGRRFDDIVGQIKASSNPIQLRFSRGNYLESVLTKASALSGDASDRLVEVPLENGEGTEEKLKITVLAPEVVCLTSPQPIFDAMRKALEHVYENGTIAFADNEREEEINQRASQLMEHVRSDRLDWRLDVAESLFAFLGVPHVVDIISSLLLERRMMVVSDLPERVAPAILALMQLMRPFSWRHEIAPFLPESHYDWFVSRVSPSKPFLVGLCTVDIVPAPIDQFVPRRQGRLTLREDIWSTRERDFLMPSERLVRASGFVRNAITALTALDTVIVDLDGNRLVGNESIMHKDRFPAEIRDTLIVDINLALGRGGSARWSKPANGQSASSVAERVNQAIVKAYTSLSLHRCSLYALSLRKEILGFYRGAFLGSIKNEAYMEYLEKLTKTDTFKDFVVSNWDISS